MPGSKRAKTAYWIFTILFCLMMGFTVYAQLFLPQVAQVFSHLGFPNYFRIELCWAKLAGLLVLILPMAPPRLKEWAYAGFAIVLVSALIAHLSVGDGCQRSPKIPPARSPKNPPLLRLSWSCLGLVAGPVEPVGGAAVGAVQGAVGNAASGVFHSSGRSIGHVVLFRGRGAAPGFPAPYKARCASAARPCASP